MILDIIGAVLFVHQYRTYLARLIDGDDEHIVIDKVFRGAVIVIKRKLYLVSATLKLYGSVPTVRSTLAVDIEQRFVAFGQCRGQSEEGS